MASEFVADSAERIVTIARALGISTEVAGKLASDWQASVIADWGGERAYVGKSNEGQRAATQRRQAVLRDWRAGERVATLARKHHMNERTVRKIVSQSGPVVP